MKFVHIADIHLDCPFTSLNRIPHLSDIRRLEQRHIFRKVIEYIKENHIPYLFIAGDLYEHEYVKQSTIEYINQLFQEIPETKIFIAPGNHDPYIKNSYYAKYNWNENVTIFKDIIQRIELEEFDLYGYGFSDFYCRDSKIQDLEVKNQNKINIVLIHGTLDGGLNENREYNPIVSKKLKEKRLNYVALGHIHKPNYQSNIVYPGSIISFGFDEPGEHGMIVGEIEKDKVSTEFIPLDTRDYIREEIKVDQFQCQEDLIEELNKKKMKERQLCEIVLIGKRNFEIDLQKIESLISEKRILKLKDLTKSNYDLHKIANDCTLKGIFAQIMLKKLEEATNDEERKNIENAIEIGLNCLEG